MAIPALAAKPDVVVNEDWTYDATIPAGEICSFEVDLFQSGHTRITEFLNGDDDLAKVHVQEKGMSM
jgi:hypothetical protein